MKTEQLMLYSINKTNTVVEALKKIGFYNKQIWLEVDESRKIEGIITDCDI